MQDIDFAVNSDTENEEADNENTSDYAEEYKKITNEINDEIKGLTGILEEQFRQKEEHEFKNGNKKAKTKRTFNYHTGSASAAASLVFAGIALIYGLSVPNGVFSAFRLSPLILIFLGAELIVNAAIKKSLRFRLNLFDIAVSACLILMTFLLSMSYVGFTDIEIVRENTEKRLAGELSAALIQEFEAFNNKRDEVLIGNVESDILLYGDNIYGYGDIHDIQDGDLVNVRIYFNSPQKSVMTFASDCVAALEVLNSTKYFLGNTEFISKNGDNYISVKLNSGLQKNLSAVEIARLTDYFAENLSTDIDDLIYTEEE